MYGFPKDFDSDVLVGCRLESVDFANFSLGLVFERIDERGATLDSVTISVESIVDVYLPETREWERNVQPIGATRLPTLVAHTVTAVSVENSGDLIIEFDDAAVLKIFELDQPYEAYSIQWGDRRFIV